MVTERIDTFTESGIRLVSGRELEADVVVTATGLSLLPLGGVEFSVDGKRVDLGRTQVYRGVLLSGLPNLALCVGYTNASWTLRADLSSRYVCRLLKHMDKHGYRSAVPDPGGVVGQTPLMNLVSGYVLRAADAFPKQGNRNPWTMGHNYLLDVPSALLGNVAAEMKFDAVPSLPDDVPSPGAEAAADDVDAVEPVR